MVIGGRMMLQRIQFLSLHHTQNLPNRNTSRTRWWHNVQTIPSKIYLIRFSPHTFIGLQIFMANQTIILFHGLHNPIGDPAPIKTLPTFFRNSLQSPSQIALLKMLPLLKCSACLIRGVLRILTAHNGHFRPWIVTLSSLCKVTG